MTSAYLPSPAQGVRQVGPLPLRARALAELLGVVAAVVIGERTPWTHGPCGSCSDPGPLPPAPR